MAKISRRQSTSLFVNYVRDITWSTYLPTNTRTLCMLDCCLTSLVLAWPDVCDTRGRGGLDGGARDLFLSADTRVVGEEVVQQQSPRSLRVRKLEHFANLE